MEKSPSHNESGTATWILVADTRRARVLQALGSQAPLKEHDRLERVDTGAHLSAFRAANDSGSESPSRPGRSFLVTAPSMIGFTQAISAYLDDQRSNGQLARLILVAPPEVLAMLGKALTPELRGLLKLEMEADLVSDDAVSIRARLPGAI
jgi:protein required for attachment to host cells